MSGSPWSDRERLMYGEDKTPDERAVANDIAGVLLDHYGFIILNVRYRAAEAAIEVMRQVQRNRALYDSRDRIRSERDALARVLFNGGTDSEREELKSAHEARQQSALDERLAWERAGNDH